VLLARRPVARVPLLHEFVQLAHRQAAGAFHFSGIGFVRHRLAPSVISGMLNFSLNLIEF
jgi:hypothetical protein